jgi:hypothetical protein
MNAQAKTAPDMDSAEWLKGQLAKVEAENRSLKTRLAADTSVGDLTRMAEIAFSTRNWKAFEDQAKQDGPDADAFDNGQEAAEFKPHWHYARPVQSLLDGVHKALHGSEWQGRKTKGAIDYKNDLVDALDRRMPQADVVKSYGGDVLKAVRGTPEANAILTAIAEQEALIAWFQQVERVTADAFSTLANGEAYAPPAERAAAYGKRDAEAIGKRASVEALLAAMKATQ